MMAHAPQSIAVYEMILGAPASTMTVTIAMWRYGIPLVTISNVIIGLFITIIILLQHKGQVDIVWLKTDALHFHFL